MPATTLADMETSNGTVRPAVIADLDAMIAVRQRSIGALSEAYSNDVLRGWQQHDESTYLAGMVDDELALVAEQDARLVGMVALDLDKQELVLLFTDPAYQGRGVGTALLRKLEHLACEYGLATLNLEATQNAVSYYRRTGYRERPVERSRRCQSLGVPSTPMHRSLETMQNPYQQRICRLLSDLDLPADYGARHRLKVHPEAFALTSIGSDVFEREQKLLPAAADAWLTMQQTARDDGIDLLVISAYRSVDYQVDLIRRKCDRGQCVEDILKVSAAPGFSEHHSGRAIDITGSDTEPLEEIFEDTAAFAWLMQHAGRFGFRLSYPRDNRHGIAYEPWHWYYTAN